MIVLFSWYFLCGYSSFYIHIFIFLNTLPNKSIWNRSSGGIPFGEDELKERVMQRMIIIHMWLPYRLVGFELLNLRYDKVTAPSEMMMISWTGYINKRGHRVGYLDHIISKKYTEVFRRMMIPVVVKYVDVFDIWMIVFEEKWKMVIDMSWIIHANSKKFISPNSSIVLYLFYLSRVNKVCLPT